MTGSDDLALELARAIAAAEEVEPHELDYSLHDYVDTDAIRSMAAIDRESWELVFEVPGHLVTVDGTGEISIDGETCRGSDRVRSDRVR